jgi:hypothetical protein
MRTQFLAAMALAVGIMPAGYSNAFAQSAAGRPGVPAPQSRGPQSVMTSQRAVAPSPAPQSRGPQSVTTSQRAVAPSPGANPNDVMAAAPVVSAQNDQIVGQIRSMEQGLEQANRLLQQRLARADQVRRQGLEKQDQKLLQQAEQMDRQAIAAYEQQLRQFEVFSQRIEQSSQVQAEQAAARANGAAPRANAGSANNANRQPASNPAPSRGFFRTGR